MTTPFQPSHCPDIAPANGATGGGGVINKLRENFRLDDLDITTGEPGCTGSDGNSGVVAFFETDY